MRLEPLERPGLLARIAGWMSRRQLGAVISPIRVIYARSPRLGRASFGLTRVLEGGLSLEPELVLLVTTQASMLNGCTFCADLHRAQAVRARIGLEKFADLTDADASPHFSERERAALRFTAETTRERKVSDATFEALRHHFDEREIVELTWVNAVGNYFNLLAVPLEIESDGLTELALAQAG